MKKLLSVTASGALAATAAVVIPLVTASPAMSVPGTPGVPQPGVAVFHEDFEGREGYGQGVLSDTQNAAGGVALVGGFTGVDGNTYTAEGAWAETSSYNGIVASPYTPNSTLIALGVGDSGSRNQIRNLAGYLGTLNGTGTANHAVSAYTGGTTPNPGPDLVEFATNGPVTTATPVGNRFLTFSVNVAAINCNANGGNGAGAPKFNFYFDDDNGITDVGGSDPVPLNSTPVQACTGSSGTATFTAPEPVLWDHAQNPYLVIRNANGSGIGNDHSFDDIKLVDVSPQIDKEFVSPLTSPGGVSTVRLTVTNTSELAAKEGWSFTDELPEGLEVAPNPNFSTTCTNGAQTGAVAGSTSVDLSGDLVEGEEFCTLQFDVITPEDADEDTTYVNGSGNITDAVGVTPPGDAELGFGDPLFGGCSDLITFDDEAESETWRRATVEQDGVTISIPEESVDWVDDEGNPAPSIYSADLEGGTWTEVWTPEFAENGYSSDFSFLDDPSEVLQFDYLNDTGIGFNIYVAVVGNNGERYWYNFRDQITDSTTWNRVRVPMDPEQWRTGVVSGTGVDMDSDPPTADEFSAVLANVDRFIISVEGRSGSDATWIDNFGQPCDDFGDAPDTYGTTSGAANGAAHRAVGLDADTGVAPLMLGSTVDVEDDATPTATANGDDIVPAGANDEDGLLYPLAVADGVATDVTVNVTKPTDEAATLAAWIDVDDSGTFEAGELVSLVIPAGTASGPQAVTLPAMTLPASQQALARFRLFSGEIAEDALSPIGPAIGGEVEDHLAVPADPDMTIVKRSELQDSNDNGTAEVGETILYFFDVENTGNVPLTNVSVDDPKIAAASDEVLEVLAPGAEHTFGPVVYVVTQEDVDAGGVDNTATATGTTPAGGEFETAEYENEVPGPERVPGLSIEKSADLDDENGNGLADEGETIDYSFLVVNTGNVTMSDIVVEDTKVTGLDPQNFYLLPGEEVTVTADPYVVTGADVQRGSVDNVATAVGTDPTGGVFESAASEVSTKTPGPELPTTGSGVTPWWVQLGLLLILLGGVAFVAARVRGRASV
ncbi:MAG: GEVED domain-containing protein [Aeromicrobium sp.]|uniref:DUF7507 domain-containing protein n=1 Tax=Aeromicrobium sp. TaxID=1871063 RepID=UPI0039E70E3D